MFWSRTSLLNLLHDFWRKIYMTFILLTDRNFIPWFPLLLKILWNMCIVIICCPVCDVINFEINPLSANFTKWSNTLKKFLGNFPTNCLSVFDHFVILAFRGLTLDFLSSVFLPYQKVTTKNLNILTTKRAFEIK